MTAITAPLTRTATVRANRFAGTCATCRNRVGTEAGRIEKTDGAWKVFHLDGACPQPLPERVPAAVGIYRHDGRIYLVRASRGQKDIPAADRRRYACVLVERAAGERRTVGGDAVRYDWDRIPGMVYDLTEAERVPVTDAQVTQMMIDTGQCIICHHGMWSAKTMDRVRKTGIMVGPVCLTYFAAPAAAEGRAA